MNIIPPFTSKITENLYQGGQPLNGDILARCGCDIVVFCASEYQPPGIDYPGVNIIYCPFDDSEDPMDPHQMDKILDTALQIASLVNMGKSVLTTCMQGRNRSGLVNALALHYINNVSADEAINTIKSNRPNALTNKYFNFLIKKLIK